MKMNRTKYESEDSRVEKEQITEQVKANAEKTRSYNYLTNLIFDAIR
jgi:hypothetical protein